MPSTHIVIPLFSYSVGESLLEKQVLSDIGEHVDADGEKGNSLRKNLERSFLGNYSVICVIISHRYSFPYITQLGNCHERIQEGTFRSTIRTTVKKEICSERNWREDFRGTALRRVHSTHNVLPLFAYSVGETLLEKQVSSDIREHVDVDDEKGNSLRQNLERSFLGNYSVICVIISQR